MADSISEDALIVDGDLTEKVRLMLSFVNILD